MEYGGLAAGGYSTGGLCSALQGAGNNSGGKYTTILIDYIEPCYVTMS